VASRAGWAFDHPLPRRFYARPTATVARALLGQLLVRRIGGAFRLARIVETEAYVDGDRANHAALGPTLRNRAMFGPPGTLYVYRIHQVHCANAVTGGGQAVLLRAAEPLDGLVGEPRGPGRLCRAFALERPDNGTSLVDGPVRIAPGGAEPAAIDRGVRVGIRHDVERRLRFAVRGSPWVSRPRIARHPGSRPGPSG
jgi:DNA-3-methyladenine glycosylase